MCKGLTKKGTPCKFRSKSGKDYCHIHSRQFEKAIEEISKEEVSKEG